MIKVLIAEDMPALLKKYQRLLEKDEQLQVVAAVQNGYEAVMQTALCRPDVILMDIEMESKTAGLDAAAQILQQYPETKIIILTSYEDAENVFRAFKLGVCDYVLKNSKQEELVSCVKDAFWGRSPIRPVIAEKIRREFQRVKKSEDTFLYNLMLVTKLTQTELDILDLLSQGYSRAEICFMRSVEMSTLKKHIHNIIQKFGMDSMAEVIECVKRLKILEYLHDVKGLGL